MTVSRLLYNRQVAALGPQLDAIARVAGELAARAPNDEAGVLALDLLQHALDGRAALDGIARASGLDNGAAARQGDDGGGDAA